MKRSSLALLVVSAMVLAACGTDSEVGSSETSGSEAAGIHSADTDLGTILVDADGYTLYVFTADTDGVSKCYDECADLWPPVPGDAPVGSDLDASMFATTTRTDETEQRTVNGQPLYRYTPDTNPGDVTGQAFNDVWFVVGVDGNMIGGAGEAVTTTSLGGRYDY
jgi:predicted lipoprotein with Yx(FWY)xxD motif